ncbi:methyltransferase domain-containing protein [Oceaniglobus trochenteri]|uniref:methyltransferase domain-containing protein n=1 Tax=Oceaniglobus trochenteri TaxID=2763260 RepID=UPI001D0002BD|nr:methyltransferase domain-containing protein [Oceaniglobus trochenteri]
MTQSDAEAAAAQECARLTFEARTFLRNGNKSATLENCMAALRCGEVPMEQGAIIDSLLRECDRSDIADQIRAQLYKGLAEVEAHYADQAVALVHMANVLILLGEHAKATPHLDKALVLAPDSDEALFLHTLCHLENGTFRPGQIDIAPVLKASRTPGRALSGLVSLLGHHGEKQEALRVLDTGLPLLGDKDVLDKRVETLRAALSGGIEQINQRETANRIFDSFAETYDTSLAALGNNGPNMIGTVLDDIGLARDNSLKVFDAGCGTGLCEPHLRPRASLLHGADLSVAMLEKCLAKGTYDLLCRSDLAAAETLPDDTFDLAVCADVLVYFGRLQEVFTNLAGRLAPGGWLIFTVEEAPADIPPPGYGLNPSGRNCHSEAYLRAALAEAGFSIEHLHRDTLRLEFRKPVPGLAVAAKKNG